MALRKDKHTTGTKYPPCRGKESWQVRHKVNHHGANRYIERVLRVHPLDVCNPELNAVM